MIRSVMYTRSSSQLLSMAVVRLMLLGKGGDHHQDVVWGGDAVTLRPPACPWGQVRQAGTRGNDADVLPQPFPCSQPRWGVLGTRS